MRLELILVSANSINTNAEHKGHELSQRARDVFPRKDRQRRSHPRSARPLQARRRTVCVDAPGASFFSSESGHFCLFCRQRFQNIGCEFRLRGSFFSCLIALCRTAVELHHQNTVECPSIHIFLHGLRTTSCILLLVTISMSSRDPPDVVLQGQKLLQCGQLYDKATPGLPPSAAMILLRKSVLFNGCSCTMPKCPISSFTTFS